MSQWWQCPRCGARLLWQRALIKCSRSRCDYATKMPTPIKAADEEEAPRF